MEAIRWPLGGYIDTPPANGYCLATPPRRSLVEATYDLLGDSSLAQSPHGEYFSIQLLNTVLREETLVFSKAGRPVSHSAWASLQKGQNRCAGRKDVSVAMTTNTVSFPANISSRPRTGTLGSLLCRPPVVFVDKKLGFNESSPSTSPPPTNSHSERGALLNSRPGISELSVPHAPI
ncbi:hypothetical protein Bbelb_062660 [Branchiostoma belcheri]|nr:hypothetical protein Bbelb_062660 [Branchiostoma belcheri]